MNRQLKFRAWDKLEKRFFYPDKGYQGHYVLTLNGQFQNLQNGSGGDEYVVQQFTGLKDKDGKEIFEGDRVRIGYTQNHDFFGEVIWLEDRASFGVRYENITETFEDLGFVQKLFEVVGNIFQSPCNPDHNGECLVCDCWLSDCPFNKDENKKI
jgi:uncharacterized phage protein (TIGR01671 family)